MLHKEDFDLISEIRDIAYNQLLPKLRNKNIKVDFINETRNEFCFVNADRSRLSQVLTNLLDNAIKFSKKDTSINIIIQEDHFEINENQKPIDQKEIDKGLVYIAISDSGKGISSDILPKLFKKFVTNSDTGTGLGLYISRKLVEVMGGRIWAFNNNDGIGSTFVFSLPTSGKTNSSP